MNETRQSIKPYEEEESYENPVNLSKTPGIAEDYIDIRSDYVPAPHVNCSIGQSKGFVNIESLELDDSIQNDYQDFKDLKVAISTEETVRMQGRKPTQKSDSQKFTRENKANESELIKPSSIKKELKSLEETKANGERENSSCKNTVKMTDRRDFSFIDSQRESNVPLNILKRDKSAKQEGWSVNDTVSRLHGINSQQMSNKELRPEPMSVNPFIHDS